MSSSDDQRAEEAVRGAGDAVAPDPEAVQQCSTGSNDEALAAAKSDHPEKSATSKISVDEALFKKPRSFVSNYPNVSPVESDRTGEARELLDDELQAVLAREDEAWRLAQAADSDSSGQRSSAATFDGTFRVSAGSDASEGSGGGGVGEVGTLSVSPATPRRASAVNAGSLQVQDGEGSTAAADGSGAAENSGGDGEGGSGRPSVSTSSSRHSSAARASPTGQSGEDRFDDSDAEFAKLRDSLVDALKAKEEARAELGAEKQRHADELAQYKAEADTLRLQLADEREAGDAWRREAERLDDQLESERFKTEEARGQLRQAGRAYTELQRKFADKTRQVEPAGDDDDKEAADKSLIIDSEKSISDDDMRAGVKQSAESVASERAAREAELRLECRRLEKRAAVDVLGDEPLAKRPCHRAPVTEALFDALVVEPPPTVTSVLEAFSSDARKILGLGPRDDVWQEQWSLLDEWPPLAQSPPAPTDAQKQFARKVNKAGVERAIGDLPRFFGTGAVDLTKPTHKRDVGWQCPICRDRRRFATLPALKTHITKQHKGECCTRCFAKHPLGKRSNRDLKRHELCCDGDTCPCGWQDSRPGGKSLGLLDHMLNAHG